MARAFDGANSKIQATITAVNSGSWTFMCYAYANSSGEGNFGTLFLAETGGAAVTQKFQIGGATLNLTAQQVGTTIGVSTTTTTISTATWYCLAASFRSSDNKVRIYIGQPTVSMAEAAYSTQQAMITRTTAGTTFTIGNRSNQTITWDGIIERAGFWTKELSTEEMDKFRLGYVPQSSLQNFWPLTDPNTSNNYDYLAGASGTGTSVTAADGAPVPLYLPVQANAYQTTFRSGDGMSLTEKVR